MIGNIQPTAAIDRDKRDEREQPQKSEQDKPSEVSFRDIFLQKWEAMK